MKNINEILNSLLQPASETKVFSKEKAVVPVSGSEGETSSFEDILAKLGSEDADILGQDPTGVSSHASPVPIQGEVMPPAAGSTKGEFFKSITSITEIDIQIRETARLSGVDAKQLEKLEQSLLSLAAGLSKLLQLVSNLQFVDPSKAQDLLVSASGGSISPKDAKDLTDLLSLTSKETGADQNPLLLNFAQQNGLLSQMFQQMINDQQLLVGQLAGSSAAANDDAIQMSDFFLQMTFSETDITMIRTADTQGSQVFINMQTFQMAASFTQVGSGGAIEQSADFHQGSSFQQLSTENSAALSAKLDQMFSNAGFPSFSTVQPDQAVNRDAFLNQQGSFNGLNQNFKNLVQLLMQTGVSQAVLTTFLNQQKDFSNSELQQALARNLSLDQLLQVLIPPAKVLPVESANSTSGPTKDAEGFTPVLNHQVFAQEVVIQESAFIETQNQLLVSSGQAIQSQTMTQTSVFQESILIESQVNLSASNSQPVMVGATPPPIDLQALTSINETVVRLNNFAFQGMGTGLRSDLELQAQSRISSVDQFLSGLGVDLSRPPSILKPTINVLNQTLVPAADNTVIDVVSISSAQLLQVALATDQFSFSQAGSVLGTATLKQDTLVAISASVLSLSVTRLRGDQPLELGPASLRVQETIGPNGIGAEIEMTDPLGLSIRSKINIAVPETLPVMNRLPVSVAENISASVVTGETVKGILPALLSGKNEDLNKRPIVNVLSPTLEVKPITPQAVTSTTLGAAANPLLNILKEQVKNEGNFSISAQAAGAIVADTNNAAPAVIQASSAQSNVANQAQVNAIDSAHVLNQISDHLSRHASEVRAVSRLNFQLMPESLGRVTVQIALVDQTVSARIVVTNPDVKETLQSHMVDLKAALNQAGLQIDQLQVQVQGGSSNLLAQYFQYQREGFGYRLPASLALASVEEAKSLENTGVLGEMSIRTSLLDVLV